MKGRTLAYWFDKLFYAGEIVLLLFWIWCAIRDVSHG